MEDLITHEIEVGNVYKDSRTGEKIQLIYIDSNIYVLQNETERSHRLGSRREFQKNVESGRYDYQEDEEPFAVTTVDDGTEEIPFENLDNIGETAASNLRNNGYETTSDIVQQLTRVN
jgi:hypothetical protein